MSSLIDRIVRWGTCLIDDCNEADEPNPPSPKVTPDQPESDPEPDPSYLGLSPPRPRPPLISPILLGIPGAASPASTQGNVCPSTFQISLGDVPESITSSEELNQWVLCQVTQPFVEDFLSVYTPIAEQDILTSGIMRLFGREQAPAALRFFTTGIMHPDLNDIPHLRVSYSTGTTTGSSTITSVQLRDAVIARIQREFPETLPAVSRRSM